MDRREGKSCKEKQNKRSKGRHNQTLILAKGIVYILLLRKTWSFGK
jgi:hypothetical protein